mmetsp:Transcript_11605/g.21125  ORF Transcript_11605/g.21125 Transcript_11605/m.21125 type:complete len:212 (-) Transcript_11605:185-820(-)
MPLMRFSSAHMSAPCAAMLYTRCLRSPRVLVYLSLSHSSKRWGYEELCELATPWPRVMLPPNATTCTSVPAVRVRARLSNRWRLPIHALDRDMDSSDRPAVRSLVARSYSNSQASTTALVAPALCLFPLLLPRPCGVSPRNGPSSGSTILRIEEIRYTEKADSARANAMVPTRTTKTELTPRRTYPCPCPCNCFLLVVSDIYGVLDNDDLP